MHIGIRGTFISSFGGPINTHHGVKRAIHSYTIMANWIERERGSCFLYIRYRYEFVLRETIFFFVDKDL